MATFPRAQARTQKPRSRFQVARALYGRAFEPQTRAQIGESMADWSELAPAERDFTLAHLLYLNLQIQWTTQRMLNAIRETLEESDDALQALADELVGTDDDRETETDESEEPDLATESEEPDLETESEEPDLEGGVDDEGGFADDLAEIEQWSGDDPEMDGAESTIDVRDDPDAADDDVDPSDGSGGFLIDEADAADAEIPSSQNTDADGHGHGGDVIQLHPRQSEPAEEKEGDDVG